MNSWEDFEARTPFSLSLSFSYFLAFFFSNYTYIWSEASITSSNFFRRSLIGIM
jgi:hypothetical protein